MKKKGYAKGGAMKKKGYAKGGAMKKKGMAKGGAMKKPIAMKKGSKLRMVEKNGKKVPFFAADGKGKMKNGGSVSTTKPKARPGSGLNKTSRSTAKANKLAALWIKNHKETNTDDFKKASSILQDYVKQIQKKRSTDKGDATKKMGGGMMKKKGMAKGGAMKKKGMAKGGAMKKKGYAKG